MPVSLHTAGSRELQLKAASQVLTCSEPTKIVRLHLLPTFHKLTNLPCAIDTNPQELRSPELPARISIPIKKSYTMKRERVKKAEVIIYTFIDI